MPKANSVTMANLCRFHLSDNLGPAHNRTACGGRLPKLRRVSRRKEAAGTRAVHPVFRKRGGTNRKRLCMEISENSPGCRARGERCDCPQLAQSAWRHSSGSRSTPGFMQSRARMTVSAGGRMFRSGRCWKRNHAVQRRRLFASILDGIPLKGSRNFHAMSVATMNGLGALAASKPKFGGQLQLLDGNFDLLFADGKSVLGRVDGRNDYVAGCWAK